MRYRTFILCIWCLFGSVVAQAQEVPEFIFEGNKAVSQEQLRNAADEYFSKYEKRGTYDADTFERLVRYVKYYLNSKGYLRAVVELPREEKIDSVTVLVVRVDEGLRYRLGEVRIEGVKIFSPAQLLEMSPLKTGDIFDGNATAEWLFEGVKKAYANLGYIHYTGEPELLFRETTDEGGDGVVDLKVTVAEGEAFTVHSIKFEGAAKIPSDILQREMLLKARDVYSRERFNESIARINQLKLFEPIDADKDVDYRDNRETAQLDITIQLKKRL